MLEFHSRIGSFFGATLISALVITLGRLFHHVYPYTVYDAYHLGICTRPDTHPYQAMPGVELFSDLG